MHTSEYFLIIILKYILYISYISHHFAFSASNFSVSYCQNYVNSFCMNAFTKTLKVHPGTRNKSAGYGWLNIIMTAKVVIIPTAYPMKQHKK